MSRETNVVVDFLVKEAIDFEKSFCVILNQPTKTLNFLIFDAEY